MQPSVRGRCARPDEQVAREDQQVVELEGAASTALLRLGLERRAERRDNPGEGGVDRGAERFPFQWVNFAHERADALDVRPVGRSTHVRAGALERRQCRELGGDVDSRGGRLQGLETPLQQWEASHHGVVRIAALTVTVEDALQQSHEWLQVERDRAEKRRGRISHAIPGRVELACEVFEVTECGAAGKQQLDGSRGVTVAEQRASCPAPALRERDAGAQFVDDLDARRQPGLDRVLLEHARSERVDGADRGGVKIIKRRIPLRRRQSGRHLQCGSHPISQLAGGLLGERDGGNAADWNVRRDQGQDARHQVVRLADAGARLDEESRPDIRVDALAGRTVHERAHASASSVSMKKRR